LPEPYEDLVKEFLELQGYFIRQDVIYNVKRGELDILGVKLNPPQVLLGEVSATYPRALKIDEMKATLTSKDMTDFVLREVGNAKTRKIVFYWLNKGAKRQRARIEQQLKPNIETISLQEVHRWLRQRAAQKGAIYSRTQPNVTTLQLMV
jgi:Holliday junction resolvase-like predicted endonuclease